MLFLALIDFHQSKQLRLKMSVLVELKSLEKADATRNFSNEESRLTKESMGLQIKFSAYCGPERKTKT